MSIAERLVSYIIKFAAHHLVYLLRINLLASMFGYGVVAFEVCLLIVDPAQTSQVSDSVSRVMAHVLETVTGSPDYSGDFSGLGMILVSFLGPYFKVLNIFVFMITLLEQLFSRRLLQRFRISLGGCLSIMLGLYSIMAIVSLFGDTPAEDFPYLVRILLFIIFYGFVAFYLVALHVVGAVAEQILSAYLPRQTEASKSQ